MEKNRAEISKEEARIAARAKYEAENVDKIRKEEEEREQKRIKRKEYRNSKKKKKKTLSDTDSDNTDYEATNIPYDSEIDNDQDIEVQRTLENYGLKETMELLTIMEINIDILNRKTRAMFKKAYEEQSENTNGALDRELSGHKYDYDYEMSE